MKTLFIIQFFFLLIWLVYWVEIRFNLNFTSWGILPKTLSGLRGIVFAPFIHSSLSHLFNNSVPLFVLIWALFYFLKPIAWRVLFYGLIATGILTWLIARPAYHIGASGVIYMLVAFFIAKGLFSKNYRLLALAFAVLFLYGSFIWYLFPIDPSISWEGHLSGFIIGVLFSVIFRNTTLPTKTYAWERPDFQPERDPFLQQFDAEGNFIDTKPPKEASERDTLEIRYIIKENTSNVDKNADE